VLYSYVQCNSNRIYNLTRQGTLSCQNSTYLKPAKNCQNCSQREILPCLLMVLTYSHSYKISNLKTIMYLSSEHHCQFTHNLPDTTDLRFTDIFHVNLGQTVPHSVPYSTCSRTESLEISSTGYSQAWCPFCRPPNIVKALKKTQSTEPNQRPGLILSSSITRLLTQVALLLLLTALHNASTRYWTFSYVQMYSSTGVQCTCLWHPVKLR